jgi:hypothetical protein
LIVFSVQLATELTSRAAPRTVLQAATVSAMPNRTTVVTFWSISASPFMGLGNAGSQERLHCASVIFSGRAAESKMRKAAMIALVALSGCLAHPGMRPLRPLEIATAPYQDVTTAALTGTLMYEGRCLLFRDEQSRVIFMPVWPAGTSFNGSAVTFHLPGKADQLLAISQEIVIGGQPIAWGTLGTPTYQPLQHQCGAYRPFFVSFARPAD